MCPCCDTCHWLMIALPADRKRPREYWCACDGQTITDIHRERKCWMPTLEDEAVSEVEDYWDKTLVGS